jgi:hypothetical protein
VFVPRTSSTQVATLFWQTEGNGRKKCRACDFGGPTERVHLVGVSISFEKNFIGSHSLPPLSSRLTSLSHGDHPCGRHAGRCDC